MERDLKLNQTVQTRQERDYSILFFSNFYLIISSFTFQMLTTFLVSSPKIPYPIASPPANQLTLSGFLAQVFPFTLS